MPPSFLRPMLFGRALQGSAFFRRSGLRAAAPAAVSALVSVFGDTTCSALISGFLCLLLHLYCSQRSTTSHFVTHTRHKVLERVRSGARGSASGERARERARARARDPRVRPPPRLPPYASTKSRRPAARGPPHTGHATRRDDESGEENHRHETQTADAARSTVGLQHGHGSGRVQPARGRVGWYTPLPAPLDCTPLHGSSRRETRPTASWTRRRLSPV